MKYVSHPEHKDYFFPPSMQAVFSSLEQRLKNNSKPLLFTDAYHKAKGLPNGVALLSSENDTDLYPAILRDPGCGFSIFKVELHPGQDIKQLNQYLLDWQSFYETEGAHSVQLSHLKEYCFGEKDWRAPKHLQQCTGPARVNEEDIYLSHEEVQALLVDVTHITNTLEVKKFHHKVIKNADASTLIGVLHSGSDTLPDLLEGKFSSVTNARHQEERELRKLGSIPLDSALGRYYYQWLLFAMNYCFAKRYLMIQSLSEYLTANNIATVILLDDRIHAGLWKNPLQANQWVQTRGVQNQATSAHFPYTYIAGHRETVSALVARGPRSAEINHLLCHGTGLQTKGPGNHSFSEWLTARDVDALARQCYFNTKPKYRVAYAQTQNLLATLSHYQEQEYITDIFLLEPMINIQSKVYIKNTSTS